MSDFGLPAGEVRRLVEPVRRSRSDDPGDDVAEAFARATWTVIAEPGDALAGVVLASVGATRALEALLSRDPAGSLASSLRDASATVATEIRSEQLMAATARWAPRVSARDAVRAIEQAARFGCRLLIPGDPAWPDRVDDLGARAPLALWARGRSGRLGTDDAGDRAAGPPRPEPAGIIGEPIAIVGARAATGYGEHVATEFAAGLADRGAIVVSGGAYGIDGAAHRGALAAGGTTVAVLAGGLDRLYPAGHDALLRRVASQGLLLAEVPCGTPPTRFRFLQRNRLIAALSCSVVVIEAGARSGSLNTAAHAAEIGRPIGAVPGPITSAASAGCHRLLREFPATCVTSVEDALALHRLELLADAEVEFDRPSPEALQVLDALAARRGRDTAEIAKLGGLDESRARAVLGRLELEGVVARGPDGWVRRSG